jgi:hypothetical protein
MTKSRYAARCNRCGIARRARIGTPCQYMGDRYYTDARGNLKPYYHDWTVTG